MKGKQAAMLRPWAQYVWTSCRARRGRWDAHQPLHHRRYAKHISLPNSNLLRATQNTAIFHKRLPAPSPTPLPHLRLFAFKLNFPLRCVRSSALSCPAHPAPTHHRTVTPFFPANYICVYLRYQKVILNSVTILIFFVSSFLFFCKHLAPHLPLFDET